MYRNIIPSFLVEGSGWLNELGCWIKQLVQAYHQYGVGLHTKIDIYFLILIITLPS